MKIVDENGISPKRKCHKQSKKKIEQTNQQKKKKKKKKERKMGVTQPQQKNENESS
jgi:hypothetical protein